MCSCLTWEYLGVVAAAVDWPTPVCQLSIAAQPSCLRKYRSGFESLRQPMVLSWAMLDGRNILFPLAQTARACRTLPLASLAYEAERPDEAVKALSLPVSFMS